MATTPQRTRTFGDGARILILDIETFPMLSHVWELWEANALDVVTHSIIACFSAKWRNGKQITKALPDYKGYKPGAEDDRAIVKELRELLDEADIAVAQNGRRFDFKRINARIIKHGMTPPSPYSTVDTLVDARRIFGFPSNKLDSLGEYLGVGNKLHTGGFKLWQECMKGNAAAWKRMKRYNAQDVTLLERVYEKFLPWMTTHPNLAIYSGVTCCPKCGSTKFQSRGVARQATRTYQRFQCQSCCGWFKGVESLKDQRASVVNEARR